MEENLTRPVSRRELSPLGFLQRSAFILPEKTAIIHGDHRYTYRQFEGRVHRLASSLLQAGLVKNDKVAFLCPNIPAMLEAHFGVPLAGGVLVTINTRLNKEEIRYILVHSDSCFLFADSEFYSLVSDLSIPGLTVIRVDDSGLEDDPYEQFLAQGSPEPLPDPVDHEDNPISINYTSGTTGKPKGVIFTHRSTYLNALGEVIETGLSLSSVYLWTLPLFHCNGWCFSWAVTAVSGTHVCLRRIDPDLIWQIIRREGVTHYNGAPTLHTMLVNHPRAFRFEQPVAVTVAGAPPSPTLLDRLRSLNFSPIHVYGLTETYGPHTICEWHPEWDQLPLDEQAQLRARQGQAYLTADLVRVVDSYMKDVPRDGRTIGEVVMRGNNVMLGYYKQPEATEEVFLGGWFHSGDLAVWHPDGYIELRDRLKDIIISGGENISTIEVEQTVVRHPAVLECAVVAIPDEKWGERPKAFVTLKKGVYASEEEILAFCKENMAHFKCPAAVEICELPKTATGKIQKYILREKEWAKLGKRIN
jgi:fatty-acyl-CoA synthase